MSESTANGRSVDLPIATGESLKLGWLGGTYTAVATAGLASIPVALATNANSNQTLGPWARPIVVRLTPSADGRVEYAVGAPPVFAPAGIQHVRTSDGVTVELKGLGANAAYLPAGEDPTAPSTLAISGSPATSIAEGGAYLFKPTISGGAAPYSLGTAAGRLPPGLRIDPIALAVTGWTNQQGAFSNIVLQAKDSAGNVANLAAFTVTVTAPGSGGEGDPFVLVSSRGATPNFAYTNSGSSTKANNRMSMRQACGATVDQLIFRFANIVPNNAALEAGAVGITMTAGFMSPAQNVQNPGNRTQITFNGGATTAELPTTGESVDSDPIDIPGGIADPGSIDMWTTPVWASAPASLPGSGVPSGIATADVNEEGTGALATKAIAGFISGRARNRQIAQVVAVYGRPTGTPTKPRTLIVGDSVAAGANDTTAGAFTGFAQRAFGSNYPWVAASNVGYSVQTFISNSADRALRLSAIRGSAITHCLMILGGNDVKSGRTGLQVYNNFLEAKAIFDALGVKLIVCTGMPRTNDTNTGANPDDAAGAMAEYIDLTSRVRAGNGVGYGFFDRMAEMATPGDETRWNPADSASYEDGIHPNTTRHTKLTNALIAAIPTIFV